MKNETTMKAKDPVTGKYVKADNCLVAMAKLTTVGVALVIGANVFGPKPAKVVAPAVPQPQIELPAYGTEANLNALEAEAQAALDRANNPGAHCSAVFKTCW